MRLQFQARRYRWVRALLVGFLAGVWLLPSTTNASDLKGFDATGPNKDYPDKMMMYGRIVGDWRVEYRAYSADEKKQPTITGEWHFGWALEGRAVADVWIMPGRLERQKPGAPKGEWGTTIRYYDPKIDAWHIVFVGPAYNHVDVFVARLQGNEIVQEGKDADGKPSRWIFSDITPDSFRWRAVSSDDNGTTWKLREEMLAHRISSGSK